MDSKQQGQEKKLPSLLKRIGRGISDFLCKKVINEEITIKVKADWLLGRKPEIELQPQPLAKTEEAKAEPAAPIESPTLAKIQPELSFDKHAEPIGQPVEKPVEKPVVEEKKEEEPKAEPPKPAQPKPQPTLKKRIIFKCNVPPSKIKTWVRQLAPTKENWRIQENIMSAGPACVGQLIEYVEDDKEYASSRQTAIDMIMNVWGRYSKDKSNKDIVFFYADQVLPFLGSLNNQDLRMHATSKGYFNRLDSEVKRMKKAILEIEEKEKNPETAGLGKDI